MSMHLDGKQLKAQRHQFLLPSCIHLLGCLLHLGHMHSVQRCVPLYPTEDM